MDLLFVLFLFCFLPHQLEWIWNRGSCNISLHQMRTVNSPILVKSFWVVCYKYVFLQRQRNSRSHKPKSKFLFWVPNDTVSEICSLFSGRRAEKTISEISPDRILYIARIFLHLLLCSANHSAFQVGCQPTLKNVEAGDVRIRWRWNWRKIYLKERF